MKWKILAGVAVLGLLWLARVAWDYQDPGSIPHVAMAYQLKLFGSAVYEYQSTHQRWPQTLDDLAETSLPKQSYVWMKTANNVVMLWPKDLNTDPKENAGVLLAYWKGGLFNELGRVWVCWGDLRTEHVRTRDLRAFLGNGR